MGQRFIPDSYIFSELTYDRILSRRYFPRGLDAMAVLGSDRASEILEEMGEFAAYPDYAIKLNQLAQQFKNYDDNVWAQNLYWNWLYSLMPLLFPKGDCYPVFMQKPAWMDKELYAALSSWAELRHDTILYAKQSGSWTGMTPSAVLQQGYVEPNPYLYARLAALAEFLITGLDNQELLFTQFEAHLRNLANLLLNLKIIAEKELTNQSLNSEEYFLINQIGSTIEHIVEFDEEIESAGPTYDSDDEMPVIADVHTVDGTTCLEAGVGYPFSLYVICNVEGQLKITRGASFSYYEFTHTANPRLTDEAWREMLKSEQPPDLPYWVDSFMDKDEPWLNNNPDFHYWFTFHTFSLTATAAPDTHKVGDIVEITISAKDNQSSFSISELKITTADSQVYLITNFSKSGSNYIASWNTAGAAAGQVWLDVSANFYDDANYPIYYRTGFYLKNATNVENKNNPISPDHFVLEQNYPNPFNSITTISYTLANAGTVTIEIYDVLGKKIRTLFHNKQISGHYSVNWNGKNELGNKVSSGVYFYKIKSETFKETKKMVLLF